MTGRKAGTKAAIFYDVDGTLIQSNIVYVYIYYALRLPKLGDKFRKMLVAALFSPVYAVVDMMNRGLFNKIVREALLPNVYADAMKRIQKAREMGLTQVLITGSLDVVMEPFAHALGIDHVIANRLEFQDGEATGRLIPPVLAGSEKLKAMQDFAIKHNIDLSLSYAFADSKSDADLLERVGFPCAVNPDSGLRTIAEAGGWPVLNFS
ncbi:MAG: HAD-IB family hydrolase [Spirochaetia bacterium]|nr:HAD-IB family hydrolase [Spirochaetia bacterium]